MGTSEQQQYGQQQEKPPAAGTSTSGYAGGTYAPAAAPPPSAQDPEQQQQQQHGTVVQGFAVDMPHDPAAAGGPGAGRGAGVPCACTAGWVLFGLGFLFTPCWLVALCLPCCTKSVNDKRAAIASAVAFMTTVVLLLVFLVALPISLGWYNEGGSKQGLATAWSNAL